MRSPVDLGATTPLLDVYPHLSAKQARSLVRAARSYQDALWIAEGDPRQAWLRLITAIEAVAQLSRGEPAPDLSEAHPEIAQRLNDASDPELTRLVTEKLVDQSRVTAKFVEFLHTYGPHRPHPRPAPRARVNFTAKGLDDQFRTIYRYRSADLHNGTPIPWPMCEPPAVTRAGIAEERIWVPSDWRGTVPMHLHMFEFVVRESLRAWWQSMAP